MKNKSTIWIVRLLLAVGTIISMFFVPWLLVKAWIRPLPSTVQEQLEEALDYDFEGVLVYIDQAGQAPQHLAAGWHNRELKIDAKPNALYKIASIGKLYDAVAVTKLVCDGLLSLDSTIAFYLPELGGKVENVDRITLRMMVKHRSGLPNFTDTPNFWSSPTGSYEESLALIDGMAANFEPDADYEYCNTNYLLLNKIMDQVLGYDNFQFIQARILDPLHLENTYPSLNKVDIDDVMSGYHLGYPNDIKFEDYGMHATAEDVGIFLRALISGSIFEGEEQALYSNIYEYEHGGWVPGYQSFASYNEALDAVLIQFYSTTDDRLYLWNVSEIINRRIVKILKRSQDGK